MPSTGPEDRTARRRPSLVGISVSAFLVTVLLRFGAMGGCRGHPHRSTGPPVPGFTRRPTGPPGSVVPRSPAVAPGVLLRRHELTDAAWDFVPRCPPVTTGPPPWRLPAARVPARRRPA